ncbi:NAD(P)-binding domain protein [Niveomyces insectorum RCEF 264]|uniref:NAD(P)-binding domain protein n=1 Tax=Niveomyces insectorum RCEF 264 TaxID=1081102 RepID=A0A167SLW7_9HYPO|nr:NAD(P)-binding domain protein [Niveomyces insectorum RCEF 264]
MGSADYLKQMFSLEGKTAVITGATGGLGRSLALALAKAGASIVSIEIPNDPNSASLAAAVKGVGSSIQVFTSDLREISAVRATYSKMWEAGVVPDILVNCAGIARRNPCEDATDEDIDLLFAINAKALYVSCQEFGRRLLALKRPGKIINIASVTAFQANRNTSVYAASKGAVMQMTKGFSNEWISKGIQVNAISPGYMHTPLTEVYVQDKEASDYLMNRVPAGRWGVPSDLDTAVLYLASPANTFTSGVSITVDGGFCGK